MKRTRNRTIAAVVLALLPACSMLPKDLGLEGDIHDGVYTNQRAGFAVSIPHGAAGGLELREMQVKEEHPSAEDAYISFGPYLTLGDIYRVSVTDVRAPELRAKVGLDSARAMLEYGLKMLDTGYGVGHTVLAEEHTTVNGHPAVRLLARHDVPEKQEFSLLRLHEVTYMGGPHLHAFVCVDLGTHIAFLWSEIHVATHSGTKAQGLEQRVLDWKDDDINAFVASFRLLAAAP